MKMIIAYIYFFFLLELPGKYLLALPLRLFSCNSGMSDLLLIKPHEILGEKSYINMKYYLLIATFRKTHNIL